MKTDVEKYKELCRKWESDYHDWLARHFLDGGKIGLREYMEAVKPPLVAFMALEIQGLREHLADALPFLEQLRERLRNSDVPRGHAKLEELIEVARKVSK